MLFSHTSCHGAFVSQYDAGANSIHARHKVLFECVTQELAIPLSVISIAEKESHALGTAMAQIKAETALERRPILLLGGAYFDEFVSLLSLEGLAEGYDVHLLVDVSISRIPQLNRITEYRLFQAGAVPVSLRQLLQQWRALEGQTPLFGQLSELLQNYDFSALQQLDRNDDTFIASQPRKGKLQWQIT